MDGITSIAIILVIIVSAISIWLRYRDVSSLKQRKKELEANIEHYTKKK